MGELFLCSTCYQDPRSIGAVAGLALAIFFTWRMLRSPSGSQQRQRKRPASTSSNSGVRAPSNAPVNPSGVFSTSDDASAQNVVDEFFQPVKVIASDQCPLLHAVLKSLILVLDHAEFLWIQRAILTCFFLPFTANIGANS